MYKGTDNNKEWAEFDANYKFVKWVNTESKATNVKTDANGILTVKGLDVEKMVLSISSKRLKHLLDILLQLRMQVLH